MLGNREGKLYKGRTGDMKRRLKEHNAGNTATTRKMGKVKVLYSEEFQDLEEAKKREVYFKTAAGRRFIKKKLGL